MARRKIVLMGGPPIVTEDESAVEAIVPGLICALGASGLTLNDATAENVAKLIALERDEMNKDINTAYAIGDKVKVGAFHAGQRAYCWLASGQNVAKGAYLTTATNGRLTATGATASLRIAQAVEAVNTATSPDVNAAGDARIRVNIL